MIDDGSQARVMRPPRSRSINPVNQHEVRVMGMSRSGNHAIINWILRQTSGRTCFLNCVEPKTNPFASARPMASDRTVEANYSPFDLRAERAGRFTAKDWLIYSYEDCFLSMICHRDYERRRERYVGASRRRHDILVLRDPFNLFASRMDRSHSLITPGTSRRIWIQHAREYLRLRKYLPRNRLAISYNRWVTDKAYRRSIAEALGLEFTDAGIERVASTAGGSSFDGLRYDGKASQMKVFERWKRYADDPAYRSLFTDEVLDLAHRAFSDVAAEWAQQSHRPTQRERVSAGKVELPRGVAYSYPESV